MERTKIHWKTLAQKKKAYFINFYFELEQILQNSKNTYLFFIIEDLWGLKFEHVGTGTCSGDATKSVARALGGASFSYGCLHR